jgi:hypothetical protein
MRTYQLMRLVREYLLPHLPGFQVHRSLVYSSPVALILRGFDFQPSYMDPAAFTVEVFSQPLYVPCDYIWYTFGSRLSVLKFRKDIWWRLESSEHSVREQVFENVLLCIREVGLPFIERLSTPEDFVRRGAKMSGVPDDPHVREAVAYSRVLVGDYETAERDMRRLYPELVRDMHDYPWMEEMAARIDRMMSLLTQSLAAAVQQLHEWRNWTLTKLGLEKEI